MDYTDAPQRKAGNAVIPTYRRIAAFGKNYGIYLHNLTSFLMKIKELLVTADLLLT